MRRMALSLLALTLVACGDGHAPTSALAPTSPTFTIMLGQPTLANNPFVPPSGVTPGQFTYVVYVGGQSKASYAATQLPTSLVIPQPPSAVEYEVQLIGPAGFDLARECVGRTLPGLCDAVPRLPISGPCATALSKITSTPPNG